MAVYRPLVVALGRLFRIGTSDVLDLSNPVNAQTGTTYTFALTDTSSPVTLSNASAITATVPANGTVAFPIGTEIEAIQGGAGAVTFAGGVGVTLNSASGNLTISAQNGKVLLRKTGTNTWYLSGDLTVTSNVVARSVSANDITSTAAKTALWSFTVPANKLDVNKTLCIEIFGDFLNTTSTRTFTLEIVYGTTVLFADVTAAQSISGTRHPYRMSLMLTNLGVTNSQLLSGFFGWGSATAPTTGLGDIGVAPTAAIGYTSSIGGTSAEDSTASKTFTVNITLSASTSQESFRFLGGIAYMLGEGTKGDTGATGVQGTAGVGAGTMPPSANSPQTTNYTAVLADAASFVDMNSGSALTFTIPPHSSVAFANGTVLAFVQLGAGAVTATAGAGVTIKPAAVVSSRQDGWVFLVQKSQDVWGATGDFA